MVFDANGLEWEKVISVDTDTGEIEYFATNSSGEYIVGEDGNLVTAKTKIPTPISLVPIGERYVRTIHDTYAIDDPAIA